MGSTTAKIRKYTVEEYLALEEKSEVKLEFYDGKIEEMPGGTTTHNQIAARLIAVLVNLLDESDKEYIVYSSDMKIQIPAFNHYVYPDAVVVCEKPEYWQDRKDIIVNPLLVAEVMSPSSKKSDRQSKFFEYRTLSSFKEYLLVSQEKPWITSFYREQTDMWKESESEGMDGKLFLKSVDVELPLQKVFKRVKFEGG